MAVTEMHPQGAPTAKMPAASRWTRWGKTAMRIVAAGALFSGGVVYTVQEAHLPFQQPGRAIPATALTPRLFTPEVLRVASVLKQYTKDTSTADRIADAIVDEGRRRKIDPALLVGVLLTEDQTLDTMARSNVGARGLMQVMPMHSGKWGCESANLFHVESNICHGASVLEDVIKNAPNIRVALLRYNGCVRGSNTRNCHTYPDKVMRVANRATAQMIALAP